MTFAEIGRLVSSVVWIIFAVINFIANREGDSLMAHHSLNGMLFSLGFIYIFLGFIHGWW